MKASGLVGSALSLLFAIYCVSLTDSRLCKPPPARYPRTIVFRVNRSPTVLYGRVLKNYPQVPHEYLPTKIYTAEVEVFCVLKGEPVPRFINITAGFARGVCYDTQMFVGGVYVFGTMKELRTVRMSYKDPEEIEEALTACKLNPPTYPLGVSEFSAIVKCPAGLPAGRCKEI